MDPSCQQRSQFRKLGIIDKCIEQEILKSLSTSIQFQNILMEFMQEGIIILSTQLNLIYLNFKAKEICERLEHNFECSELLRSIITHISTQIYPDDNSVEKLPFIFDQLLGETRIRIRAFRLPERWNDSMTQNKGDCPSILVFLEDLNSRFQEDLKIEQQKYNLTDREVEILNLLLQAYSYQDIANTLRISLNTVKFHIKNIYAKKRSSFSKE